MEENKFTPRTIGNIRFSIPLYQRLFEWEEKQILQLLTDLYTHFIECKDNPQPYYIGMFTIYREKDSYSLVDGQQRFTVLTLMAIAFGTENWKNFLSINNESRLSFFARKNDDLYLRSKYENIETPQYINFKMDEGLGTIKKYMSNISSDQTKIDFAEYIYNYATFFLSILPNNYETNDLNRYFEAMNATGKGLENHEILKVNLLRNFNGDKDFYTKVWNMASQMDKCLIRQITWGDKKETINVFKERNHNALSNLDNIFELYKYCNNTKSKDESNDYYSIKQIVQSPITPSKQLATRDERAILNFSEFLLQILWLQLSEVEREKTTDFFNTQKLLENFKKNLPYNKVEIFLQNILKYRVIFDYFIIRINSNNENDTSYFLNFSEDNVENEEFTKLLQYQAMLNVSTSSYLWLTKLFEYLNEHIDITVSEFLKELKRIDDSKQLQRTAISLNYQNIDRYWFWRLDYYLWENRHNNFDSQTLEIANNYLFKTNRSIEHVAPQNPKSLSKVNIGVPLLHCFGNLAMISSGQNSSLQNESFEMKKVHVHSFIKSKGGTIESLKMLNIYEIEDWNDITLKLHNNKMIKILIDSFPENYTEIRENLSKQLFEYEN